MTLRLLDKDPRTGVGEIAVKGDNVTRGYFKNPEATAAAFTEDGWFKTRDLGRLDRDGWLYIKGRSSTTIIGPSGENIYPEEVESVINSHEMVAESVVTSRKGRLTALVHFDSEKLKAFLESTDELKRTTQEKLENLKKEVLDYVNQKVSKFSRISEIDPQEEEFEKTATHKIKRYLQGRKGHQRLQIANFTHTPSEGVGVCRDLATPSEGVECYTSKKTALQCLLLVLRRKGPFTPSEGVGICRDLYTPLERV